MANRETDEVSGVETTGHEWDGIRELDNPLPRWWLYTFWAGIAVAAVYWVLMPAWPGINSYTRGVLGQSDRADVAVALKDLQTVRGAQAAKLKTATLQQIETDPELQAYAQAVGQSVFGDNCATWHGAGGVGAKGAVRPPGQRRGRAPRRADLPAAMCRLSRADRNRRQGAGRSEPDRPGMAVRVLARRHPGPDLERSRRRHAQLEGPVRS